jgi:hypothetical protein
MRNLFSTERPFYHFSVDDVFDSLIEVSDKKTTLFQQPFFRFFKEINDEFDARIGLYLFYQKKVDGRIRTLREAAQLEQHITNTTPWLYFGPHALEYETPPYAQTPQEQVDTFENTYREIDKFAGKDAYAKFVRLHYFSESYEIAQYFHLKGVKGLFSTDRDIGSHRMPSHVSARLKAKGHARYRGIDFIRTHFRVECFASEELSRKQVLTRLKKALNTYGFIVGCTHESDMMEEKSRRMATTIFECLRELRLPSVLWP